MSTHAELIKKRARAIAKIKEVAPHIESLANLLDETKVDLILIALAGARVTVDEEN